MAVCLCTRPTTPPTAVGTDKLDDLPDTTKTIVAGGGGEREGYSGGQIV